MLLINNNRSKAYLQNLIKNGFLPKKIIVLDDSNVTLVEHTENDKLISRYTKQKFIRKLDDLDIDFNEKEHILKTIYDNNIEYTLVKTLDINSKIVIDEVEKIEDNYIIYSGPGGTILRKDILSKEKKFIHVHPGWIPQFRGSTTIYYSMLVDSTVGASVIIFEEGIDEGPVLYKQKYNIIEKNIDFDYVLDPLVRTKTLIEFFKRNRIEPLKQKENKEINTFYIIHPFLKHLSVLKHNNLI
jgi:methionyl-tRNA formyltransferase